MIKYKFGDISCELDFNKFLKIIIKNKIKYKSDFKYFSELYELIEKDINDISHIIFDNYEYILENGVLHNLYGPALIKYNNEHDFYNGISNWFYIDGKLIYDDVRYVKRGCRNINSFKDNEIFFFEELSNKKSGRDPITKKFYRRTEGIDYIKTIINLDDRIMVDQRKIKLKKLKKLNEK